ncbi:hypothetical protein CcI49_17490 [Frankia sp. CcI49]|uniref:hypothetical protein n=1 Tax=unclassified Frankia TaxID=2632575 RepID=UPI0006CA243C|nr:MULTISPECIES: hypothetical protein [unclassified Frankia]KPM51626.1 hypothetical protein ACG83_32765 [Frankia sp. R43]ONH59249.1 hypothetical protein CcI49_17490 [Frankia sp. CcI49]
MTDRTSAQGGFDATLPLRVLLGFVAVLGTAVCLFGAELMVTNMTGDPLTRDQIVTSAQILVQAAVIAAGAPLGALLLAWLVRDQGAVRRWAVAFVIGLIVAVLILQERENHLRHCQSRGTAPCTEYSIAGRYTSPVQE